MGREACRGLRRRGRGAGPGQACVPWDVQGVVTDVVDGAWRLKGLEQDDTQVSAALHCPLPTPGVVVYLFLDFSFPFPLGWHQQSLCRGAAFSQGGQGPGAPE